MCNCEILFEATKLGKKRLPDKEFLNYFRIMSMAI
jgi:hypothetical protein